MAVVANVMVISTIQLLFHRMRCIFPFILNITNTLFNYSRSLFTVVKGKKQVFKCHHSKTTYQDLMVLKNMLSAYSRGFCFSVVLTGI